MVADRDDSIHEAYQLEPEQTEKGGDGTASSNVEQLIVSTAWLCRINPRRRLLRGPVYRLAKRGLDLVVVAAAAPFLLPVALLCAVAIKLESPHGPVLFHQKRTGERGERFEMYKFRTMVPNAQEMRVQLLHLNEVPWPDFQITNDPRVTRVGRILRKLSLDEIPQLINVVKGDMSLVGPRPTSWAPETYAPWQRRRLEVKPGITGLAQVLGRRDNLFAERTRLDIEYVDRQCLWLDIQILVRTIPVVLSRKGTL